MAATDPAKGAAPRFRKGCRVQVFYRAHDTAAEDIDSTHWHAALAAPPSSLRLCMSAGWLDATVLHDYPDSTCMMEACEGGHHELQTQRRRRRQQQEWVSVRYAHRAWTSGFGELLDPDTDGALDDWIPPDSVRMASSGPAGPSARQPRLSILAVRWGGTRDTAVTTSTENWGATNSSVSDDYIAALFDRVYESLGADHQIISAFVSGAEQLTKLSASSAAITSALAGRQQCAMYFLWPASYYSIEPGGSMTLGGGFVEQSSLFGTMQRLEGLGLPTRFPHPLTLYRQLVTKSWQAALCHDASLAIPATVAVPCGLVLDDADRAAELSLIRLAAVTDHTDEDSHSSVTQQPDAVVVKVCTKWQLLSRAPSADRAGIHTPLQWFQC
jgi:hypothetical protein